MIFKSSTVALVVSSALAFSVNASESNFSSENPSANGLASSLSASASDTRTAFRQIVEDSGVYLLSLSQKSALDASYAHLGDNRSTVVTAIEKQQNSVLKKIRSLDSASILIGKVRLTGNEISVQMSHEAAEQLKDDTNILKVELLSENASFNTDDEFKGLPFLKVKDPGDSVTVAIVGNGIDYTHAALGGAGTPEAYAQAWANRSNAWDGFPTNTVIGGLDFSASEEGYHSLDYNPIENANDANVASGNVPSGTTIASEILKQAPDAKILSYKTYDWASAYFIQVLDVIVDPNQDGDISDRPDVIVLNSYGNAGFYVEDDTQGSAATREIGLIRRLSASGSLVVMGAGQTNFNYYFNLAWRGAAPEALTVGSVKMEGDNITLSEFTPAGPTRGTHQLKPEVVAPAENVIGPVVGSGDGEMPYASHSTYAAAYAAGTVAKILANYPQLSPLEAKALVANTAIADGIKGATTYNEEAEREITNVAEVSFMGTGLVNGEIATTADAVVWDSENYHPGLAFGFVEASSSASVTRDITIRNLTDEVQTYSLSTMTNGEKANNAAISFIVPETINVPANHSLTFNITMMVDGSKVAASQILATNDFTIENYTKENVNGYLVFDNADENSAQLKMPWQVFPKNAKPLTRSNYLSGYPTPFTEWDQRVMEERSFALTYAMDFTNDSNVDKALYSIPRMHAVDFIDSVKEGGQGHMIKNIGANINPDARCESGQKLSVAVQMFDNWDLPMAEHFDKAGHLLTFFSVYTEEYTDSKNGDARAIASDEMRDDNTTLAYIEVLMDENGKPQVEFVDFDQEYEWWNPRKRFVTSSIETDVSIGNDTVVANACIDELYHDDIQSIDAWDGQLGWQFATDRDAKAGPDEQVLRFNPVIMGHSFTEIIDHTGSPDYPPFQFRPCDPNDTDWMGNPLPDDYCIEVKNTFVANNAALSQLSVEGEASTWSNQVALAPSETARLALSTTYECDNQLGGIGGSIRLSEHCPPGIMIFELGSDNKLFSSVQFADSFGIKKEQAFSVYEGAENGTVIGTLEDESELLFIGDEYIGDIYLVNAIPGTPFSVGTDGIIKVANSAALDYEVTKSYTLKVHVDYVNHDSQLVDVTIHINNRNDVAPEATQQLAKISTKAGQAIETSIASAFVDVEGDGITFSSDNLPSGVAISKAGTITGSINTAGDYQANILATDGVNTTSANVNFSVAATQATTEPAPVVDESTSSGGSTSSLFILLASLALFNRRARK